MFHQSVKRLGSRLGRKESIGFQLQHPQDVFKRVTLMTISVAK